MKFVRPIGVLLLLAFIVIQFIPVNINEDNGYTSLEPFLTETNPPQAVRDIMEPNCYDCHSNHTIYPWYSAIAPINLCLEDHIKHGKGHLNFSEWESYSIKKKDHKLEELIEFVASGEMPLESYTYAHSEAKLTQEQRDMMIDWAQKMRALYQLQL